METLSKAFDGMTIMLEKQKELMTQQRELMVEMMAGMPHVPNQQEHVVNNEEAQSAIGRRYLAV